MVKAIVIFWLTLLFIGIIALFWYNEWVYSLPTPIPKNYAAVNSGSVIDGSAWKMKSKNNKPLFLHFFNPDCPCSRFNMPHFGSLVKQYGKEVDFAIIVMSKKPFTGKEIQERFGLNVPVFFDSAIAVSCGVYSTPQAVIIDTNHRLYFRGNYNKNRYCTDKKSNYAQIALGGLLNKKTNIVFDRQALTAYGCRLPNCSK
ncbi:TlpA family protein disulfide reductase [Flavitalea flava]